MEPSSNIDWLVDPQAHETVFTPQQILDRYPYQFASKHIDNDNLNKPAIVFEQWSEAIESHNEKDRFVFVGDTIYTLTSDSVNVWRLALGYDRIVDAIHSSATVAKVRNKELDKPSTYPIEIQEYGLSLNLNYIPPTVENSKYIIETLDRRKSY